MFCVYIYIIIILNMCPVYINSVNQQTFACTIFCVFHGCKLSQNCIGHRLHKICLCKYRIYGMQTYQFIIVGQKILKLTSLKRGCVTFVPVILRANGAPGVIILVESPNAKKCVQPQLDYEPQTMSAPQ